MVKVQRHSRSAESERSYSSALATKVSWKKEADCGLHLRWTLSTGPWAQSRQLVVSLCMMAEVQSVKAGMSGLMVDGGEGEWEWGWFVDRDGRWVVLGKSWRRSMIEWITGL